MKLLLLALALLAATASAFLAASPFTGAALSQRAAAPATQLSMSCRFNAKKQKAKRNQDNMRRFSKRGKRGTSKKTVARGKRQSAAREREAEFMAKLYQHAEGQEQT